MFCFCFFVMFCFLSNLRFQEAIEKKISDVSLGHRLKFVYCGFSSLGCSWPAACLDTSPTTSMRWSNSHLPQVCLLWGSYHNSKSYRLFWGGFVTVFLLLFAGHWWAGPGANWVGILIFCLCVSYHVILEMEDTHRFFFYSISPMHKGIMSAEHQKGRILGTWCDQR